MKEKDVPAGEGKRGFISESAVRSEMKGRKDNNKRATGLGEKSRPFLCQRASLGR